MTTLRVEREAGQIRRFSVMGHAGFAASGQDIVCAAVSVLMTTCINALESVAGIVPVVEQDEENARMTLTLPKDMGGQATHDAQIILRTGLQGFEDLSSEYPNHFTITTGRNSSC